MSKFLNTIRNKLLPTRRMTRSYYDSAKINNLNYNWKTTIESADDILKSELKSIRSRARNLARNNDYINKYLNLVKVNVVGPNGVRLQVKATESTKRPNDNVSKLIENAWYEWGKKGICDITGQLSWLGLQNLIIESVARDGEAIIKIILGANNKFGFALQVLEADYLDEGYNEDKANGNYIRLGIEYNQYDRPVKYHLMTSFPSQVSTEYYTKKYTEVDASLIIHLFKKERQTQRRGVPWFSSTMSRINNIGAYEEAEIVAARTAACKMGFFTSEHGTQYNGDDKDDQGNVISEAEPGTFEQLPKGMSFQSYDPTHPNGNYADFVRRALKGCSSGMGVSYNALSSDLADVNFSSIRAGTIEERDNWQCLQMWFIENFCNIVFENFLKYALLNNAIPPLSLQFFEQYNQPYWYPKTWQWVDPKKDADAAIAAINNGLKSRASITSEQGQSFEELVNQLKYEQDLLKENGIEIQKAKNNLGGQNAIS